MWKALDEPDTYVAPGFYLKNEMQSIDGESITVDGPAKWVEAGDGVTFFGLQYMGEVVLAKEDYNFHVQWGQYNHRRWHKRILPCTLR